MSYDYGRFLQAVRERRRPATATSRGLSPTGCFYCDHVMHTVCGPGAAAALRRICEQRSGGLLDAHHLIPKQVLKREFPHGVNDLLMDPRNGVLVRRYHHDALEARAAVIPKALLPADALEFVAELGLDWYVDKMQRRT